MDDFSPPPTTKGEELEEKQAALALEKNAIGLKAILLTRVSETDAPTPVEPTRVWPSMDKHVVQLASDGFIVTAQRETGFVEGKTTDEKLIQDARLHLERCAELENERSMIAHGLARRKEWVREQNIKMRTRSADELSACSPSTAEFGLVLAREIGMEPTSGAAFAKVADQGRVIFYEDDTGVSVELYFDGKTAVRSISNVTGDVKYEETASGDWIRYLTQYFADVDQQIPKDLNPGNTVATSGTAYAEYERALAAFEQTRESSAPEGDKTNVDLQKVTQWVMENGLFAPMAGLPEETRRIAQEARRTWKNIGTGSTLASGPQDVEEVSAKVYFNGRLFVAHAAHGGDEFVALNSDEEMGRLASEALRRESSTASGRELASETAAKELGVATTRLAARKKELLRELADREYAQSDELSWTAHTLARSVVASLPDDDCRSDIDDKFAQIADRSRILASVEDPRTGKTLQVHFDGKLFGVEMAGENATCRVLDNEEMAAGANEYFELIEKDRIRDGSVPEQVPTANKPPTEVLVPDGVTRHQARLREGGPTSRGDYMDITDSNGNHLSTISGEGLRWVEVTEELRQSGSVQVTIERDEVTKEIKVRQITVPSKGTRNLDPTADEDRPPLNDAEIDSQMSSEIDAGGVDDFELDR